MSYLFVQGIAIAGVVKWPAHVALTCAGAERLARPTTQSAYEALPSSTTIIYAQRRAYCWCTCRPGETLEAERVDGSTMGIALRVRCAMGW